MGRVGGSQKADRILFAAAALSAVSFAPLRFAKGCRSHRSRSPFDIRRLTFDI